jgi:hypothetical protein
MPPVAALFAFAAYSILWSFDPAISGIRPHDTVSGAIGMGLGAGIIAVIVVVFCAIPAFAWLISRGPLSLTRVLLAGAVLGNLPFALGMFLARASQPANAISTGGFYGPDGIIRATFVGLFVGTASAAVFWLVASTGATISTAPESRG